MGHEDFNKLKRMIAEKMLAKMPDESLGELIVTMKEMLAFYGQRSAEETAEAKVETKKPETQPVKVAKPAVAVAVAVVQKK